MKGSGVSFDRKKGISPLQLPCGQCVGCRLSRARDWSARLYHEAQLHGESSFLTLTYRDECLPLDGSVRVKPLQDFMKRLRKRVGKVRFFACGEYGALHWRAHFHVLLFGCDFSSDRFLWRRTPLGFPVFRSPSLERLWPFGNCEVGSVTVHSAGYVARYVTKKITGDLALEHYRRPHPVTGELVDLAPEFVTMSRRPGIGREWYSLWAPDAFPRDYVIVEGRKVPVPRYYSKLLAEDELERVKVRRRRAASSHRADQTPARLAVREECEARRGLRLVRSLDGDL